MTVIKLTGDITYCHGTEDHLEEYLEIGGRARRLWKGGVGECGIEMRVKMLRGGKDKISRGGEREVRVEVKSVQERIFLSDSAYYIREWLSSNSSSSANTQHSALTP